MTRWSGRDQTCKRCGIVYERFRSDYASYAEVRALLWSGSPDYADWKYKRRHTVLGLWHQLKLAAWHEHLRRCRKPRSRRVTKSRRNAPKETNHARLR